MLQNLPGTLAVPQVSDGGLDLKRVEIWLEQQIWGHRFYNDQSPWLLLLEALNVMSARSQDMNDGRRVFPGRQGDEHETMRYDMRAAILLRRLLFTDLGIDEVVARGGLSDWQDWFNGLRPAEREDFKYLQTRFANFASFQRAVILLRGCQVEPERNRRFTSFHLAPRGPAMLAADFDYKGKHVNKDRRFFARGGELLYLMLNRSGYQDQLEELVKDRLLSPRSRWNRLAQHLAPDKDDGPVTMANIGYMPVCEHPTFSILAEDWIALLSLKDLPDDNLSEPLMRLSALSAIRFIVERGAEVMGESRPLMPIDALGPDSAGMRKLARDALARHRDSTRRAVERVVDQFVASDDWQRAARAPNPSKAARDLALEKLNFELKDTVSDNDADGADPVGALISAMKETALAAHNGSLGLVCGLYAEQIGLAARRVGTRWYAFNDTMLEALVLANVREPMEFEAFLERLHLRYGFVIGEQVCRSHYNSVNQQQVRANQRHLEERLRVLGLSKRLSDDCAFVLNPFWTGLRQ